MKLTNTGKTGNYANSCDKRKAGKKIFADSPRIELPSFCPVRPQDQEKNLKMMADADVISVADIPFGMANIRNLDGLEGTNGKLYIHKNIKNQDFTEGRLQKRLAEIQKVKEIKFFGRLSEIDCIGE